MKVRVLFSVVVLTSLVVTGFAAFCYSNVAETLQVDEQEILRGLATQVGEEINAAARNMAAGSETVARMPPLQAAVKAKNREQAAALLGDGYDMLRRRYGYAVGQINGADNKVLFRYHDPQHFGDDFVSSRKMIVAVHGNKAPQNGIEIGSSGVRVRGAAPILSNGELAGSIEYGMELQGLLEQLKTRTNADFAIVIDRRLVKLPDGAPEANVYGNLRGDSGTSWPLMAKLNDMGQIALVKEPRFRIAKVDGVQVGSAVVPLLDYGGAEIGVIIAAKSFGADARGLSRLAIALTVGAVIAAIGIIGIILVMFRGLVLRPVAAIAAALDSADSAKPVELPKPGSLTEVNALIAAVKRLRTKPAAVERAA